METGKWIHHRLCCKNVKSPYKIFYFWVNLFLWDSPFESSQEVCWTAGSWLSPTKCLIIWSQNVQALRSYLNCGSRGQGKPCKGSSLVPIRPNLLRTHPGNIKSLKACSQRCWTFVPKPIPIQTAQEGAFLKVEKLYHYALLYSVCLILFFCRLKRPQNRTASTVHLFILELGVARTSLNIRELSVQFKAGPVRGVTSNFEAFVTVNCSTLEDQFHKIFCLWLFFQTMYFSWPNRHVQKRYWIFLNIHWVIRICNQLPWDEFTGESFRSLGWGNFVKHKSHVPK